MRIAYFSPLPPKRTGIASYSQRLIPALSALAEVDLFDTSPVPSAGRGRPVWDYKARPDLLFQLPAHDICLYHLGNNPHFHLDIYHALLHQPGVVVLHDKILYFLMAGNGKSVLFKEFCLNYGLGRYAEFQKIIADSPSGDILRYPYPEKYPLLSRVLAHARGIILHSQTTADWLRDGGYQGPLAVVPMLADPIPEHAQSIDVAQIRKELGLAEKDLLLGCFGFIGRTKRMEAVCAALAGLKKKLSFKLLVVGIGDNLSPLVAGHRLKNQVIFKEYVSDEKFESYLAAIDILINLRYPSMGEASYTLIQAMALGKPCIVTDDGWFGELPENTLCKIGHGEKEVPELAAALLDFSRDREKCQAMGAKAREFVDAKCRPDKAAQVYIDFLQKIVREAPKKPDPNPAAVMPEEPLPPWVGAYYSRRVRSALDF